MKEEANRDLARDLMRDFARLTRLEPGGDAPQRYLWTDAFAVCNYLQLYRSTGDPSYGDLALQLVDQVHHTLGRHRDDDTRKGWISGLPEQEGRLHPTIGGLRIGKPLPERSSREPPDERLEWEQDGQYYHYLTKWMHTLNRVGRVTRDPIYLNWAMELARSAHAAFTYIPSSGGRKRMYWKMSIDLTRPLVPSMGQHDALDGFVIYRELQTAAEGDFGEVPLPDLGVEIADMTGICRGGEWVTDDPLGIGGLLCDAVWISQLIGRGDFHYEGLLEHILEAALTGMDSLVKDGSLRLPAGYRLPFRELGLAIGLAGVGLVQDGIRKNSGLQDRRSLLPQQLRALLRYEPLGEAIRQFWMEEKNREAGTWTAHREINMMMLATSLAPGEFLSV